MTPTTTASTQLSSSPVIAITDATFPTDVLRSTQPVLIDFTAAWCAPCHAIYPAIESLAARYAGTLRVGACDVDRSPELANRFDVRSVPTLVLFRDGRVVGRMVGAAARDRIQRFVEEALR